MSKDDNTQTLEQLKGQIPALINVQTFDESLAILDNPVILKI